VPIAFCSEDLAMADGVFIAKLDSGYGQLRNLGYDRTACRTRWALISFAERFAGRRRTNCCSAMILNLAAPSGAGFDRHFESTI
jgi:hypothetical protein